MGPHRAALLGLILLPLALIASPAPARLQSSPPCADGQCLYLPLAASAPLIRVEEAGLPVRSRYTNVPSSVGAAVTSLSDQPLYGVTLEAHVDLRGETERVVLSSPIPALLPGQRMALFGKLVNLQRATFAEARVVAVRLLSFRRDDWPATLPLTVVETQVCADGYDGIAVRVRNDHGSSVDDLWATIWYFNSYRDVQQVHAPVLLRPGESTWLRASFYPEHAGTCAMHHSPLNPGGPGYVPPFDLFVQGRTTAER